MKNMKRGDKIICKKNYDNFLKDKVYYILESPQYLQQGNRYIIKICNFYMRPEGVNIYPNNGFYNFFYDNKDSDKYIWEFFYTNIELRKIKIKQIEK
jgi:hypothetical protein